MSTATAPASGAEEWISRADAAKLARCHEATINRAVKEHGLETTPGPGVRHATLTVPPGEATVAGHLVQQEYEVRARIGVTGGRDVVGGTAVRVTADGAGRDWVTDAGPAVHDAGFAALGIDELSSRRLSAGVPVTEVVTVTPRRSGSARSGRIELVLDEVVPARAEEQVEADHGARTVIAAVPLAEHLDLEPGRALRLPFILRVPMSLPAPSISTPAFTVRWLLRAVLDRPLRPDATATVELCGTTAP
jgi:hypothetical protein